MGDGADDAIDRMFDELEGAYGEPYDGFDNVMYDETGGYESPYTGMGRSTGKRVLRTQPKVITCRSCGRTNLHWEQKTYKDEGKKWRLYNHRGKLHVCKAKPLPEHEKRVSRLEQAKIAIGVVAQPVSEEPEPTIWQKAFDLFRSIDEERE